MACPIRFQMAARQWQPACANLGEAAEPSAPALVLLLADREGKVCQAAATALEKIGPKSIPVLIEFLQMRDLKRLNAQNAAMENISTWVIKPAPDIRITDMQKVWGNLSWWISDIIGDLNRWEYAQIAAMTVLGKFGPAAEAATPTITQALKIQTLTSNWLQFMRLVRLVLKQQAPFPA